MRRRERSEPSGLRPPPELAAYDEARWLPLVDPEGYDVDAYRQVRDRRPFGPARLSFDAWRRGEAGRLWFRERVDWYRAHGWPGGMTQLDLLREEARAKVASAGSS